MRVKAAQLDWVGVFAYSQEEGSPAARMPEQVPKRVAQARRRELMQRQQEISAARRRRWVGRTLEVLVEKAAPDGRRGVGRSQGQAPEIDGMIRLTSPARATPLVPGEFVQAHVRGSTAYDLDAVTVGFSATPTLTPTRTRTRKPFEYEYEYE